MAPGALRSTFMRGSPGCLDAEQAPLIVVSNTS
jgi:hypothetical protein